MNLLVPAHTHPIPVLAAFDPDLIRQALERFGGTRRQAADALGISPVTLWRKIRRYKLDA